MTLKCRSHLVLVGIFGDEQMGGIAIRDWSLSFQDMEFLSSLPQSICLEAGLQICSVRSSGRFIEDWTDVDAGAIEYVASQLDMQTVRPSRLFSDRTARRYRLEVARHLGLSRPRGRHRAEFQEWLRSMICPSGSSMEDMLDPCFRWFRDQSLLPPAEGVLIRSIRTARSAFVDDLLKKITGSLPSKTVASLEASLAEARGDHGFQRLKGDVGAATLDNVLNAADRLAFIRDLDLPFDVIRTIDPSWIKLLSRRVEGETASEMRRHAQEKRLGHLALYIMSRRSHLTDGLLDLLIDVVHRIGTRSKTKVISKIAADINKVHGKERLLVDIATAAMMAPNGKVSDVIFPIAGAAKLKAIIDEHRAKGTLDVQIQTVMRGSYASHYRRMLPSLLSVLRFRSNNETWERTVEVAPSALPSANRDYSSVPQIIGARES